MFNTIKVYIAFAVTLVLGTFMAIFKYRGNKIDDLEHAAEVTDKVVAAEKRAAKYEADNRVAAIVSEVTDEDGNKYNPNVKFYI